MGQHKQATLRVEITPEIREAYAEFSFLQAFRWLYAGLEEVIDMEFVSLEEFARRYKEEKSCQ